MLASDKHTARQRKCGNCGAKGSTENQLFECTGCRKAFYCSEQCQQAAWRAHKKYCRRASNKMHKLVLSDERFSNFDLLLKYAARHMKNLRHVSLVVNKEKEDKYYIGGIQVTAGALESLLKSNSQLETLHWSMETDIDWIRAATRDGTVWKEIRGLRVLRMDAPVFGRGPDLCQFIKQQEMNITSLTLDCLVIGQEVWTWPRCDCTALVTALGRCKNVVRLNLNESLLRDSDLGLMLPRLPNLRIFFMTGSNGGRGGLLTDKSCKLISRSCPSLQALNIAYQRKITVSGVKRIFNGCPHLRMLVASISLPTTQRQNFLCLAPNLLYLCTIDHFDKTVFVATLELTGGRLLLDCLESRGYSFAFHLSDTEALSNEIRGKYHRVKDLLRKVFDDSEDSRVINEWDALFGLEV